MENAIKYLYQNFILRDVLSFVTPGAIIVLTAFLLFLPEPLLSQGLDTLFKYSRDMHWLLYIPLFGLFYMTGFAVQCFGEFLGLIHHCPPSEYRWCWGQKLRILQPWSGWDKDKDTVWWNEYYKKMEEKFWKATKSDEGARQGRERLVVLKQMCVNDFLAIVVAGLLIPMHHYGESPLFLLIVGIPLLSSLFWGHRVHVLRQYARERVIIASHQTRIESKEK